MTEEEIERVIERKMDALDARFMMRTMTQAEYDAAVRRLNEWTDVKYRFRKR